MDDADADDGKEPIPGSALGIAAVVSVVKTILFKASFSFCVLAVTVAGVAHTGVVTVLLSMIVAGPSDTLPTSVRQAVSIIASRLPVVAAFTIIGLECVGTAMLMLILISSVLCSTS